MPDATITSTASTFGTISGTFSSDQSTVTGTISGVVTGTLTGSVGVPGPVGPTGPQGPEGPPGPPGEGGTWGSIVGTLSNQTDLQTALNLKAPLASPALTGVPTGPTAATLTSTTQLATTAFVQQELAAGTAVAKNLEVYVRNQSGSTIPAGSIVYISGATGNRPLITLAQANNDANSAQTIGFVKTSIANNGFGYVIVRGELENIDTSALTEGVQLYLSPTTAGAWTTTKPSAPQHLVYVGIVIRSHPTLGVILVAVQNGYELNELHDVAISSPSNGQVLKYDSATNLWKNATDSSGVAWGGITGTLSNQTDLQSALDAKQSVSGMSAYLTKADNLGSLTNFATARDNLSLGTLNTPVFAGVTAQGSGSNVANLTPTSLSLTHTTSGSFVIQPSVGITFPDSSVQTTAFTTAQLGAYLAKASNLSDLASASTARTNLGLGSLAVVNDAPSDGNQYARKNGAWDVVSIPSAYITSVSSPLSVSAGNLTIDLSDYLTSATAASTYQTQAGMSSYLTTSAAASSYYPLTGNPSGFITSSALTGYATESWVTAGFYPLTGNPSGFITSAALSPYLLSSTASSTYQTIAGMSSYLTTSAAASTYYPLTNPSGYITSSALSGYLTSATAASTYATILEPSVDGILTVEPSGTNSAQVQVQQDANNYIHLRAGAGQIAMVVGGSTKWFFNDTYLQFPGGTQQTVAYPGPSGFLLKADNLSGLASTSTARTNLGLGTMATATASDYSTTSVANGLYYPLSSNPSSYLVAADIAGKANIASPTFTGVPAAPTATAGTNTTQIATTAFVQQEVPAASTTAAGKVELATTDEALRPSSTTLAMTPDTTREMLLYPGYIQMFGGGNYSTSGTGATNFVNGTQRWHANRSPNAGIAGYAMYIFDYSFTGIGMAAMTRGVTSIGRKWNSKIWVSGRSVLGQWAETTSGLNGDANCTARVMLGGRSSAATGGMQAAEPGIGWKVAGGGSAAIVMTVSNGSALTETTSSFTPTLGQVFDWKMYSDGTGNVTLWVNDSQVATSTGGPTTSTTENYNFYCEVAEQTASATAPFALGNFGTKVFWSQA